MNNIYLDVLHPRRPPLNYVTPAICDAAFSSTSFPTLILDALPVKTAITGLHIRFIGDTGDFELTWDNYPGVLCYSVYKLNDANDPFGDYTIIAECITDPIFRPEDWEPDFNPEDPACYIVTAITASGETALSDPICTDNDGDGIPDGIPTGGGCISNLTPLPDAELGVEYSVTFLPVGPAAGPLWTITGGAVPAGLALVIGTGVFSGIPTEGGEFDFTVRLTKDGGGFCEKAFHMTVGGSCLLHSATISPVVSPAFVEFDSLNSRILFNNDLDISVVNPATEAILGTVVTGATALVGGMVFAPSNGQSYFGMVSGAAFQVGRMDAATLTFGGSFGFPASVNSPGGFMSGDDTNNRIYTAAILNTFESALVSIDPGTNSAVVLLTMVPPVGGFDQPGSRTAYNPDNDQLYIPYGATDSLSVLTVFVNVYSSAGVLVSQIPMPGVNFSVSECCFHCPENSLIYYIGHNLASGNYGVIILNPADNSIVTTIDYGAVLVPSWICFTPGSVNIIDNQGNFKQFDPATHLEICTPTDLGHNASTTMASAGSKVYCTDVVNGEVEVMSS